MSDYHRHRRDSFHPYSRRDSESRSSRRRKKKRYATRTLFVRNIAFEATIDEIRDEFEKFGKIKRIYDIIKKRGIAFITYYDMRAAEAATRKLQNKKISGREIDIHYSVPNSTSQDDPNNGTLYVVLKDTSKVINNDEFYKFYQKWGDIKEIRNMRNNENSKFVEFYDLRSSEQALKDTNGKEYLGGTLIVKYAYAPKDKRSDERDERSDSTQSIPTNYRGIPLPTSMKDLNIGETIPPTPLLFNNPQALSLLNAQLLPQLQKTDPLNFQPQILPQLLQPSIQTQPQFTPNFLQLSGLLPNLQQHQQQQQQQQQHQLIQQNPQIPKENNLQDLLTLLLQNQDQNKLDPLKPNLQGGLNSDNLNQLSQFFSSHSKD
ncbi:protein mei2-like 4 [Anaeramoeba ignava]|uniref:Protein mei2-like 4 n=1 Tax=Anaeramoeba ignava TaxID=1746090 RepID=A0A9Q0LC94_ANAIG|nr:protein mei2-like 4 [Anaeramoeba ignava]